MSADTTLLGVGLYSLPAAARLVNADLRAVRRWLLGYSRRRNGESTSYPPLWRTQFAEERFHEPAIGFRDLLELRMVNAFAKCGVGLYVIRETIKEAKQSFGVNYPLTTKRFRTDGRRIFMEVVDRAAGEDHDPEDPLLEVRRQQWVFTDIVRPALYEGIEFENDHPRRWFPDKRRQVVMDPARQFGSPTVVGAGIPTSTLFASFKAEGKNSKAVARIYDISAKQVMAAVRFEEQLAAA